MCVCVFKVESHSYIQPKVSRKLGSEVNVSLGLRCSLDFDFCTPSELANPRPERELREGRPTGNRELSRCQNDFSRRLPTELIPLRKSGVIIIKAHGRFMKWLHGLEEGLMGS